MVDIDEEAGKTSCASLQKEFSEDDVKFLRADVTNSEELVYYSHVNSIWFIKCFHVSFCLLVFPL